MVALEPVLNSAEQEAMVDRALWHSLVRGVPGETATRPCSSALIERHFKHTGSTRGPAFAGRLANSRASSSRYSRWNINAPCAS